MRKHIDRALERRKNREIKVLRSWTDKRMDGSVIPGEAFGIGTRLDIWGWLPVSLKTKDYDFTITQESDGGLRLAVDSYEASGRAKQAGEDWDVDQWCEEHIIITSTTSNRIDFRYLSRIGRALVAGRNVEFGNGLVVPGICKVGADRALIQAAIRGGSDE